MSTTFSSEQIELQSSLERAFRDKVDSEYLRKRLQNPIASDDKLFKSFIDLGLFEFFGSTEAEASRSFRELAIVSYEAGKRLLPESLVENLLFGPYLLAHLLNASMREQLCNALGQDFLGGVISGEKRITAGVPFAYVEPECVNLGKVSAVIDFVPAASRANYLLLGLRAAQNLLLVPLNQEKLQ